jgi:hypothetical protein
MKYSIVVLFLLLLNGTASLSQIDYRELSGPLPAGAMAWRQVPAEVQVAVGNVDTRYGKSSPPTITQPDAPWHAVAWKGEKVHAQLLVWTKTAISDLRVTGGSLSDGKGHHIPASAVTTGFVRYVLTDSLNKEGHGCGIQPGTDSSLTADGIDFIPQKQVQAFTTQPVWVSVTVPRNAIAGNYNGLLYVRINGAFRTLPYNLQVKPHVLPPPSLWTFHLDLWQNPYSVARVFGVKVWRKEHFDRMRPFMQWLAAAGQKTITVSMIHDPWRGQTYDIYGTMIRWIKKKDGSWLYDYRIFDRWVHYMQSLGINKLINCYTMVP